MLSRIKVDGGGEQDEIRTSIKIIGDHLPNNESKYIVVQDVIIMTL